ncbi:type II toxin-antitoxin system HicB family antitoxin [Methanosarcina sp. KYL-1]|uniref:type II toxin-antitoxin system HicB family antitoxin n=1 Tax=Methanosarcina sp. KYL-1 TaxID=2602068 RepID=UPI0021014CB5|nr:type II toxin-antitoxin system HicB family antitoxin [Methanosarcina sp. KYL-1]MCQ1537011.1 type II toxin-antitoxin system HicB family antitoxin [Methanosarcina sp. KYL-1]
MKETYTFTAIVRREGEQYVSLCPELYVVSQGKTIEEAVSNLKEAVERHLDEKAISLPLKHPFKTTFEVSRETNIPEEEN